MGMTITEKILAANSGHGSVRAGDIVWAEVDFCMGNDITAPIAIQVLEEHGIEKLFDKDRIALVLSHFAPPKDTRSAAQCKAVRNWARKRDITHFFEIGEAGIEHILLPEEGLVVPGDVMIGADSHSCQYGVLGCFSTGVGSTDLAAVMATGKIWLKVPETMKFVYKGSLPKWVYGKDLILHTIGDIGVDGALYRAMEFAGPVVEKLPMMDRFTLVNMAVEAGAKSGIIVPDATTEEYMAGRAKRAYEFYENDPDAEYHTVKEYDISSFEPKIAAPFSPANVHDISEMGESAIDQVFIGSCTNGKYEDMKLAASVMKGRRVAKYVRAIVIPATPSIYQRCVEEGIIETFIASGATVATSTCGPCLGGHMGVLGEGERAVSTSNRNFRGRMGHPESEVYLANPAVAAASAVAGKICHPKEIVSD